jgi:hypothetical protein
MPRRKHHHKKNISNDYSTLDFSRVAELISALSLDKLSSVVNSMEDSEVAAEKKEEDFSEREQIISSIRNLVNANKVELVKVFIDLYAASKTKAN